MFKIETISDTKVNTFDIRTGQIANRKLQTMNYIRWKYGLRLRFHMPDGPTDYFFHFLFISSKCFLITNADPPIADRLMFFLHAPKMISWLI